MKLLCLLLIASCSSYFPPQRGQYRLVKNKHFVTSNMYVNPSNLEKKNGELLIRYDVIAKNVDSKAHPINLEKSRIVVTEKEFPMDCHRFVGKMKQFELGAGAQTRIVCLATLKKDQFAQSDYQSILEIPLGDEVAKFEYLLRAEDFE